MTVLGKLMPDGLPAGEYTLRFDGSPESTTFTVEDSEGAERVLKVANQLADLLKSRTHPLYLQVAVESLLYDRDLNDKQLSHLTDALDLLESVPEESLTAYLRSVHSNILRRLRGESPRDAESTLITTGIPVVSGRFKRGHL